MTGVTQERNQDGAGLSAPDEQLLRDPTKRARAEGLKLTGEGGLLGRLTKMIIEGAWKARWMTIWAMVGTIQRAATAVIPVMGTAVAGRAHRHRQRDGSTAINRHRVIGGTVIAQVGLYLTAQARAWNPARPCLPLYPIPHYRSFATFSAVLTLSPGDPQRITRRSSDETTRRHRL